MTSPKGNQRLRGVSEAPPTIELMARVYRQGTPSNQHGTRFVRAQFTNARASWIASLPCPVKLADGQAIWAQAQERAHPAGNRLLVKRWAPLTPELEHRHAIDLLPGAVCPVPFSVERLVELIGQLSIAPLISFLADVLCNPAYRDRYLTAPASRHAHHNWPGGLMEHSLEVARWVASFRVVPDTEREIGTAAALVHDIGKIRTHGGDTAPGDRIGLLRHDALTLEMLSPALARLEARWPDGALAIRLLLAAESERRSFVDRVEQRVGLVLRFADAYRRIATGTGGLFLRMANGAAWRGSDNSGSGDPVSRRKRGPDGLPSPTAPTEIEILRVGPLQTRPI
jgi:3'-5' exoribonuclease